MSKPRLLCCTLSGSQPHFLTHDAPNPDYFCQIFVCGSSFRDMAQLIARHMPKERISAVDLSLGAKSGWPPNMRWVKRKRGVWAVKHAAGVNIYHLNEGQATLLDD